MSRTGLIHSPPMMRLLAIEAIVQDNASKYIHFLVFVSCFFCVFNWSEIIIMCVLTKEIMDGSLDKQ